MPERGRSRGRGDSSRGNSRNQSRGDGGRSRERSSGRSRGDSQPSRGGGSSTYRGAEGRAQAEQERKDIKRRREERAARSNDPFRFWMNASDEPREVLVLDDQISFFRYEHAIPNPENNNIPDRFLPCNDHQDGCQICNNTESNPYYCMYLTVIDLEPYTIQSGQRRGEVIPWSRKLFTVKSGMQREWFREEDRLKRDDPDRPLRGAIFKIYRDDKQKPRTGNSIEFVEYVDEEFIDQYVREYETREGMKTEDCRVPFEYEKIMPEMSDEQIAEAMNMEYSPRPGSRQEADQFDDGDGGYDDDDNYQSDDSIQGQWNDDGDGGEVPFDTDDDGPGVRNSTTGEGRSEGRSRSRSSGRTSGRSEAPQREQSRRGGTRRQREAQNASEEPQGRSRSRGDSGSGGRSRSRSDAPARRRGR